MSTSTISKIKVGGTSYDIACSAYPIGSIYLSVNSTSPAELFGGTWEQIKDTFLLAAGNTYKAGSTGGEAKHTLTIQEMPAHKHAQNINGNGDDAWNNTYGAAITKPLGGGTDRESGMAYAVGGSDWGNKSNRIYTDPIGNSNPHNNMPPYLSVYIWKRTA